MFLPTQKGFWKIPNKTFPRARKISNLRKRTPFQQNFLVFTFRQRNVWISVCDSKSSVNEVQFWGRIIFHAMRSYTVKVRKASLQWYFFRSDSAWQSQEWPPRRIALSNDEKTSFGDRAYNFVTDWKSLWSQIGDDLVMALTRADQKT